MVDGSSWVNIFNEVFDIFTQVDPSTTRDYGGTGLGLAITHNLVHLLDGKISVESTQGIGTTFSVEIQMVEETTPALPIQQAVTIIAPDDPLRRILSENLTDIGIQMIHYLDEPSQTRIESFFNTNDIVMIRQNLLLHIPPIRIDEWVTKLGPRLILVQGASDLSAMTADLSARILYPLYQRSDLISLFDNTSIPATPMAAPPELIATKGSVLLVEDDPVNRMIATEILEQLGYTVAIAENGLKAVERARTVQYDAILMDCMMPNMDGYQATHLIRTTDNLNRDTRIIALTASVMESDRQKALASGMNDFLGKPFRRKDLAEKLEQK